MERLLFRVLIVFLIGLSFYFLFYPIAVNGWCEPQTRKVAEGRFVIEDQKMRTYFGDVRKPRFIDLPVAIDVFLKGLYMPLISVDSAYIREHVWTPAASFKIITHCNHVDGLSLYMVPELQTIDDVSLYSFEMENPAFQVKPIMLD